MEVSAQRKSEISIKIDYQIKSAVFKNREKRNLNPVKTSNDQQLICSLPLKLSYLTISLTIYINFTYYYFHYDTLTVSISM